MQKIILLLILVTTGNLAYGQTAKDFYNQAQEDFDNKNYNQALIVINKAIKQDSANIDFYSMKAQTLDELEQYQELYDTYTKAISIFPNKFFLYNNRGTLLINFREPDKAIQDLTKAIELAKNDSDRYVSIQNRGAAKINKRDFVGAYKDLLIAYKFDSTSIATLTDLGAVCDEIGKEEEAIKYLLETIKIDPSFNPAYGNIGFTYQKMGNYKKAMEYFNKSLALKPDDPLGYSNRSFNRLKIGDLKGAMDDIEISIRLYPENSYAYRTRALIYIQKREIDKACKDLQTDLNKGFTKQYGEEVVDLQKKYCGKE